jgi:hypothetical protein
MEPIITIQTECFQATKSKSGCTIIFATDVQQTQKGPAAGTAATFNLPTQLTANDFEVGQKYEIIIRQIKTSE